MLCVYKRRNSAEFLSFRNRMQGKSRFSRTFRTVHLNNSTARITAYTESLVEQNRTRRNNINALSIRLSSKFHKRAGTKLLFNLDASRFKSFQFFRHICRLICFYHFSHLFSSRYIYGLKIQFLHIFFEFFSIFLHQYRIFINFFSKADKQSVQKDTIFRLSTLPAQEFLPHGLLLFLAQHQKSPEQFRQPSQDFRIQQEDRN